MQAEGRGREAGPPAGSDRRHRGCREGGAVIGGFYNRGRRDHLWVSEASLCWLCVEDRRRRGWGEGGLMEVVKIEPVRQDRDLDRGRRGQKR